MDSRRGMKLWWGRGALSTGKKTSVPVHAQGLSEASALCTHLSPAKGGNKKLANFAFRDQGWRAEQSSQFEMHRQRWDPAPRRPWCCRRQQGVGGKRGGPFTGAPDCRGLADFYGCILCKARPEETGLEDVEVQNDEQTTREASEASEEVSEDAPSPEEAEEAAAHEVDASTVQAPEAPEVAPISSQELRLASMLCDLQRERRKDESFIRFQTSEIQHLNETIQYLLDQNREVMQELEEEHAQRRFWQEAAEGAQTGPSRTAPPNPRSQAQSWPEGTGSTRSSEEGRARESGLAGYLETKMRMKLAREADDRFTQPAQSLRYLQSRADPRASEYLQMRNRRTDAFHQPYNDGDGEWPELQIEDLLLSGMQQRDRERLSRYCVRLVSSSDLRENILSATFVARGYDVRQVMVRNLQDHSLATLALKDIEQARRAKTQDDGLLRELQRLGVTEVGPLHLDLLQIASARVHFKNHFRVPFSEAELQHVAGRFGAFTRVKIYRYWQSETNMAVEEMTPIAFSGYIQFHSQEDAQQLLSERRPVYNPSLRQSLECVSGPRNVSLACSPDGRVQSSVVQVFPICHFARGSKTCLLK